MTPLQQAESELVQRGFEIGRRSLRDPVLACCLDMEHVCSRLRGENRFEANRIIHALRELVKEKP